MKSYKLKITSLNRQIRYYTFLCWVSLFTGIIPIPAEVIFSSVTKSARINFVHSDGHSRKRLFNEFIGSGVALFDYDNDGDLDIYLLNGAKQVPSADMTEPNQMYQNQGDGTFINVTSDTNLGHAGYGVGCTTGDYDNDGFIDLYLTNFGADALYRNQGDETFINVTQSAEIDNPSWGTSCAFTDINNDGYLDLYVTNYANYDVTLDYQCISRQIHVYCGPHAYSPTPDRLFVNNGHGTFIDQAQQRGINQPLPCHGLGVAVGDYDNDGDSDFYLANDQDPNFLFQNRGDGNFDEIALIAGVAYNGVGKEEAGMGTAFGDYDNDGYLDLTVSNFQTETNTIYHNEGNDFFMDLTITTGMAEQTYNYLGWGIKFFDYDNDGWQDVFVVNGHVMDNINQLEPNVTLPQKNLLFRNMLNGTFELVNGTDGLNIKKVSRSAAFGDYDNDGDIDIIVTNWNQSPDLLRNEVGNRNHWVMFKTIGVKSNQSGIGSKITVTTENLTQYREVRSDGSYLSASDLRVHFGLGTAGAIKQVEIQWPSGQTDHHKNLSVNQEYTLIEGQKI